MLKYVEYKIWLHNGWKRWKIVSIIIWNGYSDFSVLHLIGTVQIMARTSVLILKWVPCCDLIFPNRHENRAQKKRETFLSKIYVNNEIQEESLYWNGFCHLFFLCYLACYEDEAVQVSQTNISDWLSNFCTYFCRVSEGFYKEIKRQSCTVTVCLFVSSLCFTYRHHKMEWVEKLFS